MAAVVVLLATAWLASPAQAAWGSFVSMGPGAVLSDASCAADGVGTAVCAAIGAKSALMVNRFNGSAWSGWTTLTGVVTSVPSCSAAGAGKVVCAARTTNLAMVVWLWSGSTWSAPLTVGGGLATAPSCAPLSAGQVLCAARATSSKIVAEKFSGGTWAAASWTKIAPVDFAVYSPVNCAPDDLGHAICAWVSPQSQVSVREFSGSAWSAALVLGGRATNPPICTDGGVGGKAACFATGTDSALWGNAFAGGAFTLANWGGWGSIGGLVSGYGCSEDGLHAGVLQYACGIVGLTDNGFWTNEYISGSWGSWVAHGGSFVGNPACFALNTSVSPGRVMCVLSTSTSLGVSVVGP